MSHSEQFDSVVGSAAYDAEGHKLGEVGEVYVSGATGQPAWVTVVPSQPQSSEFVVPLANSSFAGNDLVIPYQEKTVSQSPAIALGPAGLTSEQEDQLSRHYGLSGGGGEAVTGAVGMAQSRKSGETQSDRIQVGGVSPGPGDPELDL